jgi:hypothetical protein
MKSWAWLTTARPFKGLKKTSIQSKTQDKSDEENENDNKFADRSKQKKQHPLWLASAEVGGVVYSLSGRQPLTPRY